MNPINDFPYGRKYNLAKINNIQFCYLTVTENCFLRCKSCQAWKRERNPTEVTIEEWKVFIDSLRSLTDAPMEVHITGGEPLFKEGILDLVNFCAKKKFNVTMATNAYLINEELAKKIVDSGLKSIIISLNSIDEDIQDFLKGVKGSFKKTMNAIQYLNGVGDGIQICVCSIISEPTLDGLIRLTDWVSKHEKIGAISFQAITQPFHTRPKKNWHKRKEYSFLWPKDVTKVYFIIEELIRLKESGAKISNSVAKLRRYQSYFKDPFSIVKRSCDVGDYTVTLHPDGDISLCRYGRIGNIRNDDINEIWSSRQTNRIREKMKACKSNCEHIINGSYEDS